MAVSISSTPAPQVARKQHPPLSPTRGKQLRRLNELRRLADLRRRLDQSLGDLERWAKLFADVLLHHSKGHDLFVFREAIQVTMLAIDDDMALEALHEVARIAKWRGRDYRPISPTTAGKWLELTAEECWLCDIITMRPVDGPVETAADVKSRRLEQDRERKRKERSMADVADRKRELDREWARRRRAAKGAKPRAQYLAEAAAKDAERQAAGISKATYYRRRKTGPSDLVRETSASVQPLLSRGRVDRRSCVAVRGAKQLGPTSRSGRRAEHVESKKEVGRKERVAEQGRLVVTNGQHGSRQQRALEKRRVVSKVVHLEAVSLVIAGRAGDHGADGWRLVRERHGHEQAAQA